MAAARRLYSTAKLWRRVRVLGAALLVALAPVAASTTSVRNGLGIAAPLWLLASAIGGQLERHFKREAVLHQEHFDTDVFLLGWNPSLGRRHDEMEVTLAANKTKKRHRDGVERWYPVSEGADGTPAILACQRGNLVWGRQLHALQRWVVLAVVAVAVLYGIAVSLAADASLEDYLVGVVLPSTPAVILAIESFTANAGAVVERSRLLNYLDDLERREPRKDDARAVQDRIFEIRLRSPLLPDLLYRVTRARYNQALEDALAPVDQGG